MSVPASGETIGRSEGLALASLAMFRDCEFSMWSSRPLRADASILAGLAARQNLFAASRYRMRIRWQGVAGRADLLRRLAGP